MISPSNVHNPSISSQMQLLRNPPRALTTNVCLVPRTFPPLRVSQFRLFLFGVLTMFNFPLIPCATTNFKRELDPTDAPNTCCTRSLEMTAAFFPDGSVQGRPIPVSVSNEVQRMRALNRETYLAFFFFQSLPCLVQAVEKRMMTYGPPFKGHSSSRYQRWAAAGPRPSRIRWVRCLRFARAVSRLT